MIKKISPVSYQLELPNNLKIHSVIHVSELEPYYEDNFGRKQEPPPSISINEEVEFEVEEILDVKRKHYGKTQYLIKSYKNGKAIHCPIHPGNPKAILTVQNLLKNSMKINNYTLYSFYYYQYYHYHL